MNDSNKKGETNENLLKKSRSDQPVSKYWQQASAGTYVDKQLPHGVALAFTVIVFALLLIPFVGMLWARTDTTTENRQLAELPSATSSDGAFNYSYLSDLGDYFADHFAYRNELVSANSALRAALDTSSTDQVVIGSDGWLYYGGTLPDYLGQSYLSDQALQNIAHNLALTQNYVESNGAQFVFTLAPNKNSLYSEAMPYYYLPYEGASNAERLVPYLEKSGVHYVDLFSLFKGQLTDDSENGFHYLKQDSHWDNYWALLATNELLESLQLESIDLDLTQANVAPGFVGDLVSMLYPTYTTAEENYFFAGYNDEEGMKGSLWSYDLGEDVTDSVVQTHSRLQDEKLAGKSLLMFRDSFGNALLPYWAASFERATFSKLVPYNVTQVSSLQADTVVIERAERHLDYLAQNAPLVPSPSLQTNVLSTKAVALDVPVSIEPNGSFWEICAQLPQEACGRPLYVQVTYNEDTTYVFDPFWLSLIDEEGAETSGIGLQVNVWQTLGDISSAKITVYSA